MLSFVGSAIGPWPQRRHQPEGIGEQGGEREHGERNARPEDEPPRGVLAPGTPVGACSEQERAQHPCPDQAAADGHCPEQDGDVPRFCSCRVQRRLLAAAGGDKAREKKREEPTGMTIPTTVSAAVRRGLAGRPFRPPSMIVLEPVDGAAGVARQSQQPGSSNGSANGLISPALWGTAAPGAVLRDRRRTLSMSGVCIRLPATLLAACLAVPAIAGSRRHLRSRRRPREPARRPVRCRLGAGPRRGRHRGDRASSRRRMGRRPRPSHRSGGLDLWRAAAGGLPLAARRRPGHGGFRRLFGRSRRPAVPGFRTTGRPDDRGSHRRTAAP